ncbi:MAG: hypothetical protein Q8N02_01665 [Methylotenera sp.]|uniref:hypothetical protein n=1 Tax=Methylotenera sp. TaxID=2051956 RepID=UPI0027168F5E|nr:hypothetical protein [Methylotenera sp.]MDO9206078.1 hypothetical protein [Methylotenera sp.]MDP2402205.1 hypothetical protein [Methylotenera sp.]MDP3094274.1 hypothetical protein [Methylotenera sp.]MDZ4223965.1 hypothetical protein [Methylotenera sp.]
MARITREELKNQSEAYIRLLLKAYILPQTRVYLYGSRSQHDNRWILDYDLCLDSDISSKVLCAGIWGPLGKLELMEKVMENQCEFL